MHYFTVIEIVAIAASLVGSALTMLVTFLLKADDENVMQKRSSRTVKTGAVLEKKPRKKKTH